LEEGGASLNTLQSLSLPNLPNSDPSSPSNTSEASTESQATVTQTTSPSSVDRSHVSLGLSALVSKASPSKFSTPQKKRPSLPPTEPKKKRRLIPTQRAIEIANQKFESFDGMEGYFNDQVEDLSEDQRTSTKSQFGFVNPFPDGFPLTDEESYLLPDPHSGSCLYQDSDYEDEGYWSQIVSSANSTEGETAEEKEERRLKLLARFHTSNSTATKSVQAPKKDLLSELDEEEQLLK
jgi:hypothetical protein